MPDIFNSANYLFFVKIAFLIITSMIIILSIVVYNQVRVMERIITLNQKSNAIKDAALFFIILSISLFLLAVVIL